MTSKVDVIIANASARLWCGVVFGNTDANWTQERHLL